MKAYKHLVKHALSRNLVVSVYDGEVWGVKKSNSQKDIFNCIESVEESQLIIRDVSGIKKAWVLVVLGNADDELVADCSDNEFMKNWNTLYKLTLK